MITKFKIFEEIKYTSEHVKLVSKVRYALNKYFGKNCCGVTKVRYVKELSPWMRNSYKWIPYTGNTMLFSICAPSFVAGQNIPDYELKIKNLQKLSNELKFHQDFEDSTSFENLTEEQMIALLNRIKYLETLVDAEKYNL